MACTVEGCDRPIYFKRDSLCSRHYSRWRSHGDPLGGSTGIGEARNFFEKVVLPYDGDDCLIWPFSRDNHGYGQLRSDGRPQKVSRLACIAVHGAPPKDRREAAHNCGKGLAGCVNPRHLRWASRKENMQDKLTHGTQTFGEASHKAKLKEDEAREIKLSRGVVSQRELAKKFGVSRWTVQEIHNGKNWARLEI